MPTDKQRVVFAQTLKHARQASGLSQRALSKAIGVSHGAVWQYEEATVLPKPETVSRLEKVLDLPSGHLGQLVGYVDTPDPEGLAISVLAAIRADPLLTETDRRLLSSIYQRLVQQRQQGRSRELDDGRGIEL